MFQNFNFNQLTINKLGFVNWKTPSPKIFENYEEVIVWKVNITLFLSQIDVLKDLLMPTELEKAMRYKQENDQNQRIISKAVLRILLSKYIGINLNAIVFSTDLNKKPVIKNFISKPIYFNVAHSGDYILIAVAASPTGIDVEQLDAVFTYQNLLSYSFSNAEVKFIENSAAPYQTFFELWTRKEALLKATGQGLEDDLTKIPCLNGVHQIQSNIIKSNVNWQVSSFNIDENHVGSIAFMPAKTALQFVNFQL